MKRIGITGGVGAGKSEVLKLLPLLCHCFVMKADHIASELEARGRECFQPLLALLGDEVLAENGEIDRNKMAQMIFTEEELRKAVNAIVHPAVKREVFRRMETAERAGYDWCFLEAALLIEDHYHEMLHELWFVSADREVRIARLIAQRGYDRERALHIMHNQCGDAEFRMYCVREIDNSGTLTALQEELKRVLFQASQEDKMTRR